MTRFSMSFACLAFAVVALLPDALHAQRLVGAKAGVSIATFGGADADEADNRTGPNVGGFVAFPLAPSVMLQLDAAWVGKGAQDTDEDVTFRLAIGYIEIPIQLRWAVPSTGNIGAHFLIGPAVAFNTSCKVEIEGEGASISVDCGDEEFAPKRIDFGGKATVGVDYGLSPRTTLFFEAGYTLGLTNITEGADDLKNRAFTVQAGAAFALPSD